MLFSVLFFVAATRFADEPFPPSWRLVSALLVCLVGGAVTGLLGHVACERAFPAFRIYEAVFTTPFFLFLSLAFMFGYQPALKKHIYDHAPQWQGTEHYTFPDHADKLKQKKAA